MNVMNGVLFARHKVRKNAAGAETAVPSARFCPLLQKPIPCADPPPTKRPMSDIPALVVPPAHMLAGTCAGDQSTHSNTVKMNKRRVKECVCVEM